MKYLGLILIPKTIHLRGRMINGHLLSYVAIFTLIIHLVDSEDSRSANRQTNQPE